MPAGVTVLSSLRLRARWSRRQAPHWMCGQLTLHSTLRGWAKKLGYKEGKQPAQSRTVSKQ